MSSFPETAVCLHCGYSLRGLPENVCPECGKGFDLANRRTWRDAARPGHLARIGRQLKRLSFLVPSAPRKRDVAAIAPVVIWFAWTLSTPAVYFPWYAVFVAATLLLAISLYLGLYAIKIAFRVVRASLSHATNRKREISRQDLFKTLCIWAWLLVLWAFAGLATVEPTIPIDCRLAISASAFKRIALQVRATHKPIKGPIWVGLIHIDRVGVMGTAAKFEIYCGREGGTRAFLYDPDGAILNPGRPVRLGADWFATDW